MEDFYLQAYEEKVKQEDNDEVNVTDVFGSGITGYFRTLKFLIVLFCFLTLMYLPIMILYRQGHEFEDESSIIPKLMLGNLG